MTQKQVEASRSIQKQQKITAVYFGEDFIEIKDNFVCLSCGHMQELEVPFGADFFWPDR